MDFSDERRKKMKIAFIFSPALNSKLLEIAPGENKKKGFFSNSFVCFDIENLFLLQLWLAEKFLSLFKSSKSENGKVLLTEVLGSIEKYRELQN